MLLSVCFKLIVLFLFVIVKLVIFVVVLGFWVIGYLGFFFLFIIVWVIVFFILFINKLVFFLILILFIVVLFLKRLSFLEVYDLELLLCLVRYWDGVLNFLVLREICFLVVCFLLLGMLKWFFIGDFLCYCGDLESEVKLWCLFEWFMFELFVGGVLEWDELVFFVWLFEFIDNIK